MQGSASSAPLSRRDTWCHAARGCTRPAYIPPNDRTFSLSAATTPGFASRSGLGTICGLLPTAAPP